MIRELVDFGESKRREILHPYDFDCICIEDIEAYVEIEATGRFRSIITLPEPVPDLVEDVIRFEDAGRTSNVKARLLVDNPQYVLGLPAEKKRSAECFASFQEKLALFADLKELDSVRAFYEDKESLISAQSAYTKLLVEKKVKKGNIAFLVAGEDAPVHRSPAVVKALRHQYEAKEMERKGGTDGKCSVCGATDYRVSGVATHGSISKVPDGQSSGCYLVSYNKEAFKSYSLDGNDNAAICTHCIKNYTEALNWLMTNGVPEVATGRKKGGIRFTNRKRLGPDTAFVFWTRESANFDFLDLLDEPSTDSVRKLLDAPYSGGSSTSLQSNRFFGLTLSGAAARIAVRDWIETSLEQVHNDVKKWFSDIAIHRLGAKGEPPEIFHPGIPLLAYSCKRKEDTNDKVTSRIAALLWRAAIKHEPLPLRVLSAVMNRIKAEQGKVTPERASLIRLFLNRNCLTNGGGAYMVKLDHNCREPAYLCGRLFAVLERLQYHAQGEVNAGIGERFFTSASSTPALAFGRLMKLSKQHLSKLKGDKPGLAVNLDKEIQSIAAGIASFPTIFRLEEQGVFALGYYHQKNFRAEKEQ